MNTCDTCKWWFWWEGFEERNSKLMKPCNHPLIDHQNYKGLTRDGITVENSVDSYIVTGPDFGCVHGET